MSALAAPDPSPSFRFTADSPPWAHEIAALWHDGRARVTAADVVDWARQHPESAVSQELCWSDTEAGQAWRLSQARALIRRVHVWIEIAGREEMELPLAIHVAPAAGYRLTVQALIEDEDAVRRSEAKRLLGHLDRAALFFPDLAELIACQTVIRRIARGGG